MTLTVLGSGTLLPDARRRSAAHLLETPDATALIDCGPGTLHGFAEHGVDWRALTHVVLTHFHGDHFGDLGAILFALKYGLRGERDTPLTILGPPGLAGRLEHLAAALGPHVLDPGFPLEVAELKGTGRRSLGVGDVAWHPTPHTDASLCLRFDAPGTAVGFTGDTGPDGEVASFLSGCGVLVAECSLTDPPEMDGHLSPRTLAELAATARPDLLLVTHVYPPLTPEAAVEQVRRAGYPGPVRAARDGMKIRLGDGSPDP